jgi:rubrerythrin
MASLVKWITEPTLSLSFITLLSLLVNAVTIYRWISGSKKQNRVNDQAFHMIRGLALASTRRSAMIVNRIRALEKEGKQNEEAMIFLENMYSDTQSTIETLLAASKALKPEEAKNLPFDGESLFSQSVIESTTLKIQQQELLDKMAKKGNQGK